MGEIDVERVVEREMDIIVETRVGRGVERGETGWSQRYPILLAEQYQ